MQTEWRNDNSYRNYPFTDGSTMLSRRSGLKLPADVFVDGFVCPVSVSGRLYLSAIDLPAGLVTISDATGVLASALADEIDYAMSTAELRFYDNYGRYFGTLVTGPGFVGVGGGHTFAATATEFAPACIADVPRSGVEGFLLPDGSYVAGDVVFEGVDGVRITSAMEGSVPVVTFDAVGTNTAPECVTVSDPLKCIKVSVAASARTTAGLRITRADNVIHLGHWAGLEDVCDANAELPDTDGTLPLTPGNVCIGPTPEPPCQSSSSVQDTQPCPSDPGNYYIVSGPDNSLGESLVEVVPVPGPGVDAAKLMEYIGDSNLAPKSAQGITLRLRGVPRSVRIN